MKKQTIITFLLFIATISLFSCNEKIKLVGEFKETALIYGILDQSESVHLIKINRAFIGPGNANDIAKIPDSSYFQNVNATVYEYVDQVLTKSWVLEDTILDTKNTNGIFYAPLAKFYFFKTDNSVSPLNNAATYKLEVIINKGLASEFSVTGETTLISGLQCNMSNNAQVLNIFESNPPSPGYISDNIKVTNTGKSAIINNTLIINIEEYQGTTLINTFSPSWSTRESQLSSADVTFSSPVQGQTFYELIRDNVSSNNNAIDLRRLKSYTIKITGGAIELNNYINANKPSSSLAQTKPSYTNLKVSNDKNVIGIFSARQTITIERPFKNSMLANVTCLDHKSRKELCTGITTGNLFFKSNFSQDALQSFYQP